MSSHRKGIELSINMVILMILALLVLGVALYSIFGISKDVWGWWEKYPKLEANPTPEMPIMFLPTDIVRGRSNKMTIGFYNNELQDVTVQTIPRIQCVGIAYVTVRVSGLNIPVGKTGIYSALVSVPKTTAPEAYPCTLTISKTQNTFFMEVK